MTTDGRMRKIVTTVIVMAVVVVIAALGLPPAIAAFSDIETKNPPKRKDAEYTKLIIDEFPAMQDASRKPIFTVVSSERIEDNWYRVTIANNTGGDQIYTLVNDTKYGTQGMSIALPTSKRFSATENLTNIPIPDSIIQEMNCTEEAC